MNLSAHCEDYKRSKASGARPSGAEPSEKCQYTAAAAAAAATAASLENTAEHSRHKKNTHGCIYKYHNFMYEWLFKILIDYSSTAGTTKSIDLFAYLYV